MRSIIFYVILAAFFVGCDDGDLIVTSFDFEETNLEFCGGPGGYLFFKLNNNDTESLSVRLGTSEELFLASDTIEVALNGTSNFVVYRIFSSQVDNSYFCNEVPPTTPTVDIEYFASSGIASLETITTLVDNDNLDSEDEGTEDTDNDGLLDFFDFDDDGDNVPTLLELDTLNEDGDNDPLTNPKNSDDDEIPDYLDPDDDNDGIPTRYEDTNMNLDPTDDVTDPSVGADYLNDQVQNSTVIDVYREHTYNYSSDVVLILRDLSLSNGSETIIREFLNMGAIDNISSGVILIIPEFIEGD